MKSVIKCNVEFSVFASFSWLPVCILRTMLYCRVHAISKDEQGQRFRPFDFVTKFPLVVSVQLFGEYGKSDKTTRMGQGVVSSFIVLLSEMKEQGYSFYDPVTVDSCVDNYGRIQIADGVLLRRASPISSSVDTMLAADALDQILSHGHHKPLLLPEVHDLLEQMRLSWKIQNYSLLAHSSTMPEQFKGHALSNCFELLMYSMKNIERSIALSGVFATRWDDLALSNLVLAQYYYYRGDQYRTNTPEQLLVYCRNSESHILSNLKKLEKFGLIYTKDDHQRLMHDNFWMFFCGLYQSLWSRRMCKWLKPEDYLCGGACCPVNVGCVRTRCFLKEVTPLSEEHANACVRIVHEIRKKHGKVITTAELPEDLHASELLALVLSSELFADVRFLLD